MANYIAPAHTGNIFNSSDYEFQDQVMTVQQADTRYLNITNDNEHYYTTKTSINNTKAKLIDFSRTGTVLSIANTLRVNGLFKPTGTVDLTQASLDYNTAINLSNCYASGYGAGNIFQAVGSISSFSATTNVGYQSCATGNNATTVRGGSSFGSFSAYPNTGVSNSAGDSYCSYGLNSLYNNTNLGCCCFGNYSGYSCPTTNNLVCFGQSSFRNLAGANSNTGSNVAFGYECAKLVGNNCQRNTIIGVQCLNGSGSTGLTDNTCVGYQCMTNCSSSSLQNSCLGSRAGSSITSGNNNCLLGYQAGTASSPVTITSQNNNICIGNSSVTNFYAQTAITVVSDERDKTDIEDLPINGLDYVMQLKPKLYKMNDRNKYINIENDGSFADQHYSIGFLAQDIQETESSLNLPNELVVNTINENKLGIVKENIIPFIVDAIKRQQMKLTEITSQIEILESNL